MSKYKHDVLPSELLTMTNADILLLYRIQNKVVQRLDRLDKLTDKEENLVHVAIAMAFSELRKVK